MLPERTPARKDAGKETLCTACGTENLAGLAECQVCGKRIADGFHPLDTIRSSYNLQGKRLTAPANEDLFPSVHSPISETAWACTVYSMVPYLGILFIPIAIAIGGFGYLTSRRTADGAGGRMALISVGVSGALLVVQIVFWWLLYLIPEIGI